jgi:hypothetical protein
MFPDFYAAVSAITYSVIMQRCLTEPNAPSPPFETVVRFVRDQQARMPDYLKPALRLLTLTFDGSTIPFRGRPFHQLPHVQRWRQMEKWKGSRLGFRRDLMRFYESLVIFGWHAEVHGSSPG